MLMLVLCSAAGPISVGFARVGGDATRALIAIALTSKRLTWSRRGRLAALLPAWILSAAMGLVVANAERHLSAMNKLAELALLIGLGVAVYGGLVFVLARPTFELMAGHLRAGKRRDALVPAP